jgi:hypothetical protein
MTLEIAWSLLITLSVIVGALCVQIAISKSEIPSSLRVPGVDLFVKTWIDLLPSRSAPFVVGGLWMVLSLIIGLPEIRDNIDFKKVYDTSLANAIVFAIYSLLGPLMVASYLYLVESLGAFPPPDCTQPSDKALYGVFNRGDAVYQVVLVAATLTIQYLAIASEVKFPSGPAWVSGGWFTEAGSFYYCLRGLETYMSLALITVIAMSWYDLSGRFTAEDLVEASASRVGPSESIKAVGTGLVLCVLVGTSATTAHGVALLFLASQPHQKIQILVASTWVMWLASTIMTTATALSIVVRLRYLIVKEVLERRMDAEAQFVTPLTQSGSAMDASTAKARADLVEEVLSTKLKVTKVFDDAETWPLPGGLGATLGFALIGQLINIGSTVLTYMKKTP